MPPADAHLDAHGVVAQSNDLPPVCSRCDESGGLCVACAENDRSILPQLAQPTWVRMIAKAKRRALAGTGDVVSALPALNTPGRKAARRLARALAGEFTPVRRTA
jgi:hypothetical protein